MALQLIIKLQGYRLQSMLLTAVIISSIILLIAGSPQSPPFKFVPKTKREVSL